MTLRVALVVLGLLLAAACSAAPAPPAPVPAPEVPDGPPSITVLAAEPLRAPYETLAQRFRTANPEVDLRLEFVPDGAVLDRLRQGPQADVLATGSAASMKQAVDDSYTVGDATVYARDPRGEYGTALLAGSSQTDFARAWITLVTGPDGKAEMSRAGLTPTR